jgi:hypothetical protein
MKLLSKGLNLHTILLNKFQNNSFSEYLILGLFPAFGIISSTYSINTLNMRSRALYFLKLSVLF